MHRFKGRASLHDKGETPAGPSQSTSDLQSYLDAKYGTKSKKKKKKVKQEASSLRIVDNDVTGFAPVEETVEVKVADPDAPVVVGMREVMAVERLEQKKKDKAKRGGWVSVDDGTEVQETKMEGGSDLSPPRRTLYDPPLPSDNPEEMEDLSPPRRQTSTANEPEEDTDLSPPRRPTHHDRDGHVGDEERDLSPPRKPSRAQGSHSERKRMMDGTATGMLSGEEMRQEIHKKRRQDKERLRGLDDSLTGKGAETVFRNRDGRRVTLEELEKERARETRKVKWEKVEWNSGLVQQEHAKKQKAALDREKQKPLARARDDEDLDAMYRARRRWGDPMGHLDKKPKTANPQSVPELPPVINETNRHWFEKSGFVIPQDVPPHSWIKRGVAPLSNRYNIRPGRHWDGVDRSNGFEKDYAKYLNECAARDKEAAAWCMEDM